MKFSRTIIALENRLKSCRNVRTLGVKPQFSDYTPEERQAILEAPTVYYPSSWYAELFDTMGKPTFPSHHTYRFAQDKIKQNAIFDLIAIPHPLTRIFYGPRQHRSIRDHFDFPFIAKTPRGSARGAGVYLIHDETALCNYLAKCRIAYIQEYLPIDRDIRVVVVANRLLHAYWRIAPPGEFRSNVAAGGHICLEPVPWQAIDLALHTASRCHLDDVGIDICRKGEGFVVLEINVKYGKEGFLKAGLNYSEMMENLIEHGII
jgi:ribosomal protein S6--L-glutamate ligase